MKPISDDAVKTRPPGLCSSQLLPPPHDGGCTLLSCFLAWDSVCPWGLCSGPFQVLPLENQVPALGSCVQLERICILAETEDGTTAYARITVTLQFLP